MSEAARKQKSRAIGIKTPLGEDVLLLVSMQGTEELGRMFQYELELISDASDNKAIDYKKILGQNVTIRLDQFNGEKRYFNGYVSWFALTGIEENRKESKVIYHYQATVVPNLWFLTRNSDCRIFQEKSVPDILKVICEGLNPEFKLSGKYTPWTYCVQYRESDFNFISRLMENEGIYYYFKHEDGKHTVVFCDATSAHSSAKGYDDLTFDEPDLKSKTDDFVWDWVQGQEITPTAIALTDYNMETPKTDLLQKQKIQHSHDPKTFEVYDYPGGYEKPDEGRTYADVRMKELQAQYIEATAVSSARGIFCGAIFKLQAHRVYAGMDYLITAVSYRMRNDDLGAGMGGGGGSADNVTFRAQLTCIPKQYEYHPPRITPKPVVQGPQTAVVVGPSGEEIFTDKYGRVKVQFFWDREGKKDEHSSCWMRVSQNWAGKNWGIVFHPRIGQEVIVDFLEGDPDDPIITGRVYNADQMPPYALPANQTQSGIKTRSSKGGDPATFNEIRFEDKKGSEQLFIHAEKNQDIEVENDETHSVGHDRTKTIDHDETTSVKHDRTETVDNNETITIGSNRTENVGKDENITIGNNRTETVGKDESITIGGSRTENVGKDEAITIGGGRTESVAKDESISINGGVSRSVAKDEAVSIGKNLTLDVGDQITITCGDASITMKKDGTVTINGKDITLNASGKFTAKASSDAVIKGSSVKAN